VFSLKRKGGPTLFWEKNPKIPQPFPPHPPKKKRTFPYLSYTTMNNKQIFNDHVSPLEAEKLQQRLRLEGKETLLHELKDRFRNF